MILILSAMLLLTLVGSLSLNKEDKPFLVYIGGQRCFFAF